MLAFARRRIAALTEATIVAVTIGLLAGLVGWGITRSLASTTYVTPEGTSIVIDTAGPWTAEQIHRMLVENGLDSVIGPTLTVVVQDTSPSQTTASASKVDGVYQNFRVTIYLKGVDSNFATKPDAILGHEFGHAWTFYHLYMTQAKDWTSYLTFRGLLGDPRLDSSYNWSKSEMIADDYRLVMGSDLAKSQMPGYINADVPHPSTLPGFREFFLTTWAGGVVAPSPTPTPTPAPSATPSPSPTPTPTPSPTPAPTPSPTPAPSPTSTPAADPTPTPAQTPGPTTATTDVVTDLAASPQTVRKSTAISFTVAVDATVHVTIVDATGNTVKTLAAGTMPKGSTSLGWNRTDDRGRRVPKGTYHVVVSSNAGSVSDLDALSLTAQ